MELDKKIHLYYKSAAIVLLISIAYVSLMPSKRLPETEFNNLDKIIHAFMYFVLSISIAKGFFKLNDDSFLKTLIPIVLSFFYGFFIEILQDVATDSRFFEIFDILANGIGCLIALALINTQFFNKKLN